ncbi:hypothetical protein OESDEN_19528 [Oesophagostomum dentatum]|uniref:Uncharacterized protein n=1 Tax=Oesophagostomum dentatum TaxID=61180 RepID=A0A0B1S622_OESDE|nr:hypothetical protein OESDEN_19528 [Oesophagostomum dentatum]
MCAYEAVDPCNFTEPPIYHVYRMEETLMDKCTGRNGEAICTCTTDLCNGDMTLIKERWDKSDDVDEDVRQCVSKYLAESR